MREFVAGNTESIKVCLKKLKSRLAIFGTYLKYANMRCPGTAYHILLPSSSETLTEERAPTLP